MYGHLTNYPKTSGLLSFESVDWVKQIAIPSVGGPQLIWWGPEKNKKVEEGRICSLCLTELRHWSSALGLGNTSLALWSLGLWTWTRTYIISCPQFSGLWTQVGTTLLVFLGHQLADSRWWDISASKITWVDSHRKKKKKYIYIYIYIYIHIFCFSGEPWLVQKHHNYYIHQSVVVARNGNPIQASIS